MAAFRPEPSAWARARELAARTPETRNRYVDFLRAASILVVVFGHWLMAAPSVDGGAFSLSDMLHVAAWSQWLTWLFQVMPLFFVVGVLDAARGWPRDALVPTSRLARRLCTARPAIVPLLSCGRVWPSRRTAWAEPGMSVWAQVGSPTCSCGLRDGVGRAAMHWSGSVTR